MYVNSVMCMQTVNIIMHMPRQIQTLCIKVPFQYVCSMYIVVSFAFLLCYYRVIVCM